MNISKTLSVLCVLALSAPVHSAPSSDTAKGSWFTWTSAAVASSLVMGSYFAYRWSAKRKARLALDDDRTEDLPKASRSSGSQQQKELESLVQDTPRRRVDREAAPFTTARRGSGAAACHLRDRRDDFGSRPKTVEEG